MNSAVSRTRFKIRTIVVTAGVLAAGSMAIVRLAGPQGIPLVLEKHRQIEELRRKNAQLEQEIQNAKERIRNLSENRSDVELEIRRQLKLLKKEETTFLLPDAQKQR